MWSYYGAKTNVVKFYPKPKYKTIIEPFAGSARYALKYWDNEVILIDKYERIIDIWKYLQACSPNDILKLPRPKKGQTLYDFNWDSKAQRDFMGFVVTYGSFMPGNVVSICKSNSRGNFVNYTLNRVAKNLHKIKHWKIISGDYTAAPNIEATWFIDPPYEFGGHKYKHSNKDIDFLSLRQFAETRMGQVIVCENTKASWMDFKPMKSQRGSHRTTTEAIWTNEISDYDNVQIDLAFPESHH